MFISLTTASFPEVSVTITEYFLSVVIGVDIVFVNVPPLDTPVLIVFITASFCKNSILDIVSEFFVTTTESVIEGTLVPFSNNVSEGVVVNTTVGGI